MGDMRFASGSRFNLLASAQQLTATSEWADYVDDWAADGDVGRPWIASDTGPQSFTADLCEDSYGTFDAWDDPAVPDGWGVNHTAPGAIAEGTTTGVIGGSGSCVAMTGGVAGQAYIFRNQTFPAGQWRTFTGYCLAPSYGTSYLRVQIRNMITGRYLTSAGAWSDASAYVFTSTAATQQSFSVLAQIEDYDACASDTVIIQTIIHTVGPAICYVDEVNSWPAWDVLSVHGHNADALQAPALYRGTTSPAATLVTTLTPPPAKPSFYIRASSLQAERYFKVTFPAVNSSGLLHVGELALWQSRVPSHGWTAQKRSYRAIQGRAETMAGREDVIRYQPHPPREIELSITSPADDAFADLAGELWFRTGEGQQSLVIIPDDDKPAVLYGRVAAKPLDVTPMVGSDLTTYVIPIREASFPVVGL